MFDHVGFLVRDSAVSLPFYTACLKPLGIERVQDRPEFDAAIFAVPGRRGFLFIAGDRKRVPSYWRTGQRPARLQAAGRRREANYVAFVLDPDNNNIEASWPNPAA